jgi:hypothetical protein
MNARLLLGFIALIGCTSKKSDVPSHTHSTGSQSLKVDSSPALSGSRMPATSVVIGANDSICDSPAGPMPNGAVVGHWYANDARAHRKTFGKAPPDSSGVRSVTNSAVISRVSRAIDSSLLALDGKQVGNSPTPASRENLYYAGGLYAMVDLDQQFCGGDDTPLPIVFFVDTSWRYIGTRSN